MSIDGSSRPGQQSAAHFAGLLLEIEENHDNAALQNVETVVREAVLAALAAGLAAPDCPMELYVELVNNEESRSLNEEYRGKDYPTNILSFPGTEADDLPKALRSALAGGPPVMLGDLMIAADVVVAEAKTQSKPVKHHFAHLVVHGVLHLLGYDHMEDAEAEEMEALERKILSGLGIPDPYEER